MSCEACEKMQLGDGVQPHNGLRITDRQTRLRPLGRRPVFLKRYCCCVFGAGELEAMAGESYWHLQTDYAKVDEARKSLGRIRRRLMQEQQRIEPTTWKRR